MSEPKVRKAFRERKVGSEPKVRKVRRVLPARKAALVSRDFLDFLGRKEQRVFQAHKVPPEAPDHPVYLVPLEAREIPAFRAQPEILVFKERRVLRARAEPRGRAAPKVRREIPALQESKAIRA